MPQRPASTRGQGQVDLCEPQASLIYTVRPASILLIIMIMMMILLLETGKCFSIFDHTVVPGLGFALTKQN